MPNTPVQAAAEGMPKITRRLALRGIATLPAIAAPGAAMARTGASQAATLIEAHREAYDVADAAWMRLSELQDATDVPYPRVQVSRLLKGRDDDGNDIWDPIYKYDLAGIEAHCVRDRDCLLSWNSHWPHKLPAIHENFHKRVARLTADLQAQEAEVERIEAAAGITDARAAARAASDHLADCLARITTHQPASLTEAAEIARYLIDCDDRDIEGFDSDREPLMEFMRQMAGRVA